MRRNSKGFTLVELLVVMAIIAILASIVVPNVIKYLASAKATRARADIAGIESALVKVLADSGRTSLHQLFNANAIGTAIGVAPGQVLTTQAFQRAQDIYSRALYAILRDGRGAATTGEFAGLFNDNVVRRLGTNYMDLGFDPWQNLFNIYPGPWPSGNGAIPFRKHFAESATSSTGATLPGRGDKEDALTGFNPRTPEQDGTYTYDASGPFTDPDTGDAGLVIGFPAQRDKVAFVWSNGANLVSGQAVYNNAGYGQFNPNDGTGSLNFYQVDLNQEVTLCYGGDDVNNWDNGSSWSKFY